MLRLVLSVLLLGSPATVASAVAKPIPFSFGAAFGSNMVLQQAPAKAAVYGFTSSSAAAAATAVKVTVSSGGKDLYSVDASIDTTVHQPFGAADGYGPLPCTSCPPYNMSSFSLLGKPAPAWKALLKPTTAGGNYTITAVCTGCDGNATVAISNVAFGDMWYCSGQSNMWLPVSSSFTRNDTVSAIKAGKYTNIRVMAGSSGTSVYASKGGQVQTSSDYGGEKGSNPWMTAEQSIATGASAANGGSYPLFQIGATCWYFAQRLAELGVDVPIGITNTAIGGQRIEEYMYNTSTSIGKCSQRSGESTPWWDARLFATQVSPFVDMTVKGWLWYQGENNMGGVMGNSDAGVGYSCEQQMLVDGWRQVWSETEGTTDPAAPFGLVTLANSGSEGNPGMGRMHLAQTAGYGVLPPPSNSGGMINTFFAQAYDLDDEWDPTSGPCYGMSYNRTSPHYNCCGKHANTTMCTPEWQKKCEHACSIQASSPSHGGIHPRSKKQVGDRLGTAAFNSAFVYGGGGGGGKGAATGPTLAGCAVSPTTLTIKFNATLLQGDTLNLQKYGDSIYTPYLPGYHNPSFHGGSQLWVQVNASNFCVETAQVNASDPHSDVYCPTWAGGVGPADARNQSHARFHNSTCAAAGFDPRNCKDWKQTDQQLQFNQGWINLPVLKVVGAAITADITQLDGQVPTAVRYAWGDTDCCDLSDPDLYVTHGCVANCPIMSSSNLPANPFMAKITDGKCKCLSPQVCDE